MRCRRKNSIVTAITPHQSPTGDSFPSRGSLSGERSSPTNTPSITPLNNNIPVYIKHNERESRAHRSGLLQYSALNKITGFNVTNLCACRSDGLGFQRDKPAQWFSPFDNHKKQRIVLFRALVSTTGIAITAYLLCILSSLFFIL